MELKAKDKAIKPLKYKIGENLNGLGFENDFLETTPKALSMKEKFDKFNSTLINSRPYLTDL